MQRLLFSEREVVESLHLSRTTLWRLRRSGQLRYHRIRSKVFYSEEQLGDLKRSSERNQPELKETSRLSR
jgi:hypothetical protein